MGEGTSVFGILQNVLMACLSGVILAEPVARTLVICDSRRALCPWD